MSHDEIFLHIEDPGDIKHSHLIYKTQEVETKPLNDLDTFIKYSSNINDFYQNIDKCKPEKDWEIYAELDDLIIEKKWHQRQHIYKLKISLVFISQFYFRTLIDICLNLTQYLIDSLQMPLEDRKSTLNNKLDAVENNLISKGPMPKYQY